MCRNEWIIANWLRRCFFKFSCSGAAIVFQNSPSTTGEEPISLILPTQSSSFYYLDNDCKRMNGATDCINIVSGLWRLTCWAIYNGSDCTILSWQYPKSFTPQRLFSPHHCYHHNGLWVQMLVIISLNFWVAFLLNRYLLRKQVFLHFLVNLWFSLDLPVQPLWLSPQARFWVFPGGYPQYWLIDHASYGFTFPPHP